MVEKRKNKNDEFEVTWAVSFFTYISFAMLILIGHLRDFVGTMTGMSRYIGKTEKKGYATLFQSWDSFFTRRLYHRIRDCWNRPICSSPGSYIQVMERLSNDYNYTFNFSGKVINCFNTGSYNYLGFAENWQATCKKPVFAALDKWPLSMCSSRQDVGNASIHEELEKIVAEFVGKEAAVVYGMGYDTNASTIPALMGTESLIISDCLNHTSIVNGARGSTANIRVFRHNDIEHLETVLREAIVQGQPRFHRPWKKILVMVEGIYSMEGDICWLPEIVKVCKKYKAYIYVDEAHSIGALGKTGRGVCEHTGVDPKDIDILMGTFTKSFSGMGGYIAASKEIVEFIRKQSAGILYHNSISPIICQQIITAFQVIMGLDGTNTGATKLQALKDNANFFRQEMKRIGLYVLGDDDSPIVPVMLYMPGKICEFSRECLKRGVAVVVVGFPATSIETGRARFCISAGHTRADLVKAVQTIEEVAHLLCVRFAVTYMG